MLFGEPAMWQLICFIDYVELDIDLCVTTGYVELGHLSLIYRRFEGLSLHISIACGLRQCFISPGPESVMCKSE